MSYKHINFVQRCKISAFWKAGYLQKDIAKEQDINPSTVSRELKKIDDGMGSIALNRPHLFIKHADKIQGGRKIYSRCYRAR